MSGTQDTGATEAERRHSLGARLLRQWEEVFFLVMFTLLCLQVYLFIDHVRTLAASPNSAIAVYASFEIFIGDSAVYFISPVLILPLVVLILLDRKSRATRRYLDAVGIYIVVRMFIQLIGLNLLLFDNVTQGLTLISQLLLILPYSLLVWGWIYWRIDKMAAAKGRQYFRVDCEKEVPRPADYLVASFSTVFSASISAIKGRSARAKMLIIIHGFFVYDLMGLTLSRAIVLAQVKWPSWLAPGPLPRTRWLQPICCLLA